MPAKKETGQDVRSFAFAGLAGVCRSGVDRTPADQVLGAIGLPQYWLDSVSRHTLTLNAAPRFCVVIRVFLFLQ